jgi:hypothetical protein
VPFFAFVQGPLGAGKTFTASVLAHLWKAKVEKAGGKLALFSNYGLKGSLRMNSVESWFHVADAHGSVIVWDEVQQQFDSRTWSRSGQVTSTKILNFCRKMGSVQIFVGPNIRNVDARIRDLVEVLIHVSNLGQKGIRLDFYDYQAEGQGYGRFLATKFIPMSKMKKIFKLKLYNTFAIVNGFPMPSNERQEKEFFHELEARHNKALQRLGLMDEIEEHDELDLLEVI